MNRSRNSGRKAPEQQKQFAEKERKRAVGDPGDAEEAVESEFKDAGTRAGARPGPLPPLTPDILRAEPEIGSLNPEMVEDDGGDETTGPPIISPVRDEADDLGNVLGIPYQEEEPLHTEEKLEKRDRNRWELNPASSEDYEERIQHRSTRVRMEEEEEETGEETDEDRERQERNS